MSDRYTFSNLWPVLLVPAGVALMWLGVWLRRPERAS